MELYEINPHIRYGRIHKASFKVRTDISICYDARLFFFENTEGTITVNGKTVVVKEVFPEISGVIIVAEGANKILVKNKILQATSSLLDVNVNKIEILTMG